MRRIKCGLFVVAWIGSVMMMGFGAVMADEGREWPGVGIALLGVVLFPPTLVGWLMSAEDEARPPQGGGR